MEIIIEIVQQIPPIWPRITALLALTLLFFLPEARRFLTRRVLGDQRIDQLKNLLELRKLELEVEALRDDHPDARNSNLDAEIEKMRRLPIDTHPEASPLTWPERAQFALAGALSGVLINSLALWIMSRFDVLEPTNVLFKELVIAVAGGLLASVIPSRARWHCVFRGILIPAIVAALGVTAFGQR